jgi:hypothetical protein
VANRVDTPVNPVQPPGLDRTSDRPLGKAKWSFELPDRNDSVLTVRHLRQSQ